jgi:hypothetical protein
MTLRTPEGTLAFRKLVSRLASARTLASTLERRRHKKIAST